MPVERYAQRHMAKNRPALISRFRRLDRARRLLAIEAAITLAWVSTALRVLPFSRAIRLGAISLGKADPGPGLDECIWAIETAARHLPWRIVCIQQGIAAQRMLRRRGIDATLHYGIANNRTPGRLEAHVWVTVAGRAVVGGAEAREFAPVAAYP